VAKSYKTLNGFARNLHRLTITRDPYHARMYNIHKICLIRIIVTLAKNSLIQTFIGQKFN